MWQFYKDNYVEYIHSLKDFLGGAQVMCDCGCIN